jgi:hypothetical protein
VFDPESVTVPAPLFVSDPEPDIAPEYVPSVDWMNVTAALFVMLPWRLDVVPTSDPAETVVPPE